MKSKFDTIVETYISTGHSVAPVQPVRTSHTVPKNTTKNAIDKNKMDNEDERSSFDSYLDKLNKWNNNPRVDGVEEGSDKDKMKCNKPTSSDSKNKKFKVKACKDGKEKIVQFGDPNLNIKKSNPERKKSYCARSSGIKGKNDKFSANYWSRKKWDC